jgi:hypothetical protein
MERDAADRAVEVPAEPTRAPPERKRLGGRGGEGECRFCGQTTDEARHTPPWPGPARPGPARRQIGRLLVAGDAGGAVAALLSPTTARLPAERRAKELYRAGGDPRAALRALPPCCKSEAALLRELAARSGHADGGGGGGGGGGGADGGTSESAAAAAVAALPNRGM